MPSSASFPHDLDDRGCGQRRRLHDDDDDDDDDEVGETALDDLLQWGGPRSLPWLPQKLQVQS